MSWNDQGNNNGSRDPWGRNNNPPPDIDELIKKFRAQINSIFGGGSGEVEGGIKKILPSYLIAIVLLYSALVFIQLMLKKKQYFEIWKIFNYQRTWNSLEPSIYR
jgi:membrane protease subunit HflK